MNEVLPQPAPKQGGTNLKKGILYGIAMIILVGLQPIIANARNMTELDAFLFATMTCIVQSAMFLPVMLVERKKLRNGLAIPETKDMASRLLHGWKRNKKLLVYIGINFGIAQILFFVAYELAGEINGALAQKSTIVFSLLFGFMVNKERITRMQVALSGALLFGLMVAITQGSFNLLELNAGTVVMMITAALWMLAHAITKRALDRHECTPVQLVFVRNGLSGMILFTAYLLFFPFVNLAYLLEMSNIASYVAMGIVYGLDLFCWYKVLGYVGVSKAGALASPTPIATAIFALLIGKMITMYHVIGMAIIIVSIFFIFKEKEKRPVEITRRVK